MSDTILHRTTHISFPNLEDTKNHDITTGIAAGSLSLDEILLSKNLNFGEYNSNKFEVQLYGIADVSGQKIVVWQTEDGSEDKIPIFTGYVDSCKQDAFGYYRDLVAYDELYLKGSMNVASWWTSFWQDKTTLASLKDLRTSLFEYAGIETVELPEAGLLNDDVLLSSAADVATLTFGDILKMICELQCTFPNMNREGKLELIQLSTKDSIRITDNLDVGGSSFEDYTTEKIDAVYIYDASPVVVGTGSDVTDAKNIYKIQGNLIAYGILTKLLDTVARSIFDTIKDYSYIPGDLNLITSNLDLHLGDRLEFASGKYTYVFENVLSGSLFVEEEIRSSGDQYLQASSSIQTSFLEVKKQIEASQFYLRTFTNAKELDVGDSRKVLILSTRLSTAKQSMLVFNAEIPIEVTLSEGSTKCVVTVAYNVNETDIPYTPIETFYGESGDKHTLHLFYPIPSSESTSLAWLVYLTASGGSLVIEPQGIQATIFGEGMSMSVDLWDGTISVSDSMAPIILSAIAVAKTTDSVSISLLTPLRIDKSETIAPTPIPTVAVANISDTMKQEDIKMIVTNLWVDKSTDSDMTYNKDFVMIDSEGKYVLKTTHSVKGTADITEGDNAYIDSVDLYIDGIIAESVTV